jgi:uncharacterized protein YdaU (DUF1376 family)
MNYYSHHIGDYLSATAHLTLLEHGAYRRLIDVYYIHEAPLPGDKKQLYRLVGARTKEEKEAVDSILDEFFEEDADGWHQNRCDHEIYLCNKNRTNGKRGGRPSKSSNPEDNPTENPKGTQTKTQKKPKANPSGKPPITPSPHHPITGVSHSENTTTTTGEPQPEKPLNSSSSESAEAGQSQRPLSWAVFEWEKARGKIAKTFIGECDQSVAWAAAGLTEPRLREAYDLAVAQRVADSDPTPINPKFLDVFVAKVLNPKEAGSAVKVKAWYESAPGIEAKGKELGIDPPDPLHGGFPAFKARVFEAAGLTAEA